MLSQNSIWLRLFYKFLPSCFAEALLLCCQILVLYVRAWAGIRSQRLLKACQFSSWVSYSDERNFSHAELVRPRFVCTWANPARRFLIWFSQNVKHLARRWLHHELGHPTRFFCGWQSIWAWTRAERTLLISFCTKSGLLRERAAWEDPVSGIEPYIALIELRSWGDKIIHATSRETLCLSHGLLWSSLLHHTFTPFYLVPSGSRWGGHRLFLLLQ